MKTPREEAAELRAFAQQQDAEATELDRQVRAALEAASQHRADARKARQAAWVMNPRGRRPKS